jgi:hypothetical protein
VIGSGAGCFMSAGGGVADDPKMLTSEASGAAAEACLQTLGGFGGNGIPGGSPRYRS